MGLGFGNCGRIGDERVVDTRGWISADFHVHAIASGDSSIPLRDRLASFRAQDVDAIVASDH